MIKNIAMKNLFTTCLLVLCATIVLPSCQHDEPEGIKPVEERSILLLSGIGEIYDVDGKVITTLPSCQAVSQIIVDGNDYFVSGSSSKDRVGYWKNGKWNTLHVDFIDDVEHWTAGIGKWDYYIFLLDYPNVLKNSGIFRLKDSESFIAANHGISVSEGKCYVVGSDLVKEPVEARVPVVYHEHKGEYVSQRLILPKGVTYGDALSVYAYDRDHVIVGGNAGREPAIWVDNVLHILHRGFRVDNAYEDLPNGIVTAIVRIDGHTFAAGHELYEPEKIIATVWRDGVPEHLKASGDDFISSEVMDIQAYGSDLYLLTHEYSLVHAEDHDYEALSSVLWMNGKVVCKIPYKGMMSFAVY